MAQLLDEIQWGEPLLPPDIDPAWEAELKRRGAAFRRNRQADRPNPWIREACLGIVTSHRPRQIPPACSTSPRS